MKKTILFLSLFTLLGLFVTSCKTEPEIFAPYKDITVVYGLLDSNVDTNFVKINKAFLGGNAQEIALIEDSCNYPGKLDCRIIEYRARGNANGVGDYVQTKVMQLDTITIHDKEPGLFYSPNQLVYYTTSHIHTNKDGYMYRYKLEINRGDTVLTATTDMVGGDGFGIPSAYLSFSSNIQEANIKWKPCPNAAVYEVIIKFRYTEIDNTHPSDSVQKCMVWPVSRGAVSETSLKVENGSYVFPYHPSDFFTTLRKFMGNDTLKNVDRVLFEPSLTICISAGGEDLYNFIAVNAPSNSIVQTIPEYTNLTGGGYGVFSSRTQIEKNTSMNSVSFTELLSHENWRFRQGR